MTRGVGPSERAALDLLACCPRIPGDTVATLLGLRHRRSAAQLLGRLRKRGLATYRSVRLGPIISSWPLRLWSLTSTGNALVSSARGSATCGFGKLPEEPARRPLPARQRDLPMLVAAYRLLAAFASSLPRPVRVATWEHPWIRTCPVIGRERQRHVRLPAAAALETASSNGSTRSLFVLLIPDHGTLPLGSYRPALRGLIQLRQTAGDPTEEPRLVVGVATPHDPNARANAWRALLNSVAHQTGSPPLDASLITCAPQSAGPRPRVSQLDDVFALVARHPLLTRLQLAALLATSSSRVGHLVDQLLERGWVRPVHIQRDIRVTTLDPPALPARRPSLLELTETGRLQAARRLLLPPGLIRRRHGLLRADSERRALLRHLQHTLGANAFFVELATMAMGMRRRGIDVALVEWRSAAACARGHFRPDGFGCFRSGPSRFGFFLEYDRGTERATQYAAKLATYFRCCVSGSYLRDFASLPSLLVVCTTDAGEARFARQLYLAQDHHGHLPASFLTTTQRLHDHPYGALGSIWRGPGPMPVVDDLARGSWLPLRPAAAFIRQTGC